MRTINDLNLNSIAAFLQVAEKQSFRGAAKSLGVSKSTLSQRVSALEDRLGVQLLWRTTRTVRLTDIGESFYRAVEPAFATILNAEQEIGDIQVHPRGRLRMSAPVEMGQCVLGGVLLKYAALYPDVDVVVDLSDRKVNLIEEGFDLAVRTGPLDDSSLICKKLSVLGSLRLFASPGYLKAHGVPQTPRDLADHDCLAMTGEQEALTWHLEGPDGTVSVPVKPRMAVGSWNILRELVVSGLGIAQLPELTGMHEAAGGHLEEIMPEWAPQGDACYAVYPSGRNPSPALRAMVDLLSEQLSHTLSSCGVPPRPVHKPDNISTPRV
jgi:DNA-binding transcriptional LysR family regulator